MSSALGRVAPNVTIFWWGWAQNRAQRTGVFASESRHRCSLNRDTVRYSWSASSVVTGISTRNTLEHRNKEPA